MKKVFVFEHAIYNGSVEKELYYFCLRRQISLIKYFFSYILYSFLNFIKVLPKKKYYEKRFSFLKDIKDVEGTIRKFWSSRNRRLSPFTSDHGDIWISEYPSLLLREMATKHGVDLIANEYEILTETYNHFEDVYHLYGKKQIGLETQIYDQYHSKLKKIGNANFIIVHNRKAYSTSRKYWFSRILTTSYTYFMLLAMAVCLGVISMYFGASEYTMEMFLSYFKVDYLPFLNIFPVVLCIFLLYFIFNRVWLSFLLTSILTLGLTWINFFKLLIRNDPLLAADMNLFFESLNMAGKYEMNLNWKIISVIIACIIGTAFAIFFIRGKSHLRVRLIGFIALSMVGIYSFNHYYMNTNIYDTTENFELINRWSGTQLFISKGFIYPFIYSIKTTVDIEPEGFNKKAMKEKLNSYQLSNIPDDKKVNVISIMLESYNDFSKFEQIEFNEDVYDYWHQLEEESYSGELVTNIFGGGTIDTERSFLTGYTSLTNFRTDVNSYVRYFKGQGYTVEGSHPSYEWFYNRKNVNNYFGFDNYYFYEDHYAGLADGEIAKDSILFPEIIKFYEENKKTGKPYFSFNVTYQNHGPYATEPWTSFQYIKNKGYTDEEYNILNNYLLGIYMTTNEQLKPFIEYFRKEKEPVVIILFGDHNPGLGDNNIVYKRLGINLDVSTEEGFYNYYNTPYLIWGNDSAKEVLNSDLQGDGPKIGPYFLMNEFFELAGYEGNEFMKISNELKEVIDVVHSGRYKEFGYLKSNLSPESEQLLNEFLQVQYYWKKGY